MLRGIFFLDCDYCKETYSSLRSIAGDQVWSYIDQELEECALEDGWCHCLDEDTNTYQLMCGGCIHELAQEAELAVVEIDDQINF